MFTLLRSLAFKTWIAELRDVRARSRIAYRILAAERGNFGDCRPVGEGISEMRVDVGPGYRVYYVQRGKLIYLLLIGGDKKSQRRDIALAKRMLKELKSDDKAGF